MTDTAAVQSEQLTVSLRDPFASIAPPIPARAFQAPARSISAPVVLAATPYPVAARKVSNEPYLETAAEIQARIDDHADAFMKTMKWGPYKVAGGRK
jgi:hypothetical protein